MATGILGGVRTLINQTLFNRLILIYTLLLRLFSKTPQLFLTPTEPSQKKNTYPEAKIPIPKQIQDLTGQGDIGSMGRFAFNRERNLTSEDRRRSGRDEFVEFMSGLSPAVLSREQRWPGDDFLCLIFIQDLLSEKKLLALYIYIYIYIYIYMYMYINSS